MRSLNTGRPTVLQGIRAYLSQDFSEIVDEESELHELLEEGHRVTQLQTMAMRAGKEDVKFGSDVSERKYVDRKDDYGPDKLIIKVGDDEKVMGSTRVIFTSGEFDRNLVLIKDYNDITGRELIQNFNVLEPTVRAVPHGEVQVEFEVRADEPPYELQQRMKEDLSRENFSIEKLVSDRHTRLEEPAFEADYNGGSIEYGSIGIEVRATGYTDQFEGVLETLTELDITNPNPSTRSKKLASD